MKKILFFLACMIICISCSKKEQLDVVESKFDEAKIKEIFKRAKSQVAWIPDYPVNAEALMNFYSIGFQTGYYLKNGPSVITFPSYFNKFQFNNMELFNRGYATDPIDLKSRGPLGSGGAIDTVRISAGHGGWFEIAKNTTNTGKLYLWSDTYYLDYNAALTQFMETWKTNEWYDIAARLGFYDGLGASGPYQVTSVIHMDGVTYNLPWPVNCSGCQPF